MSVLGNAGCGGPDGRGTRGARRSWRVAIFFARTLLRRVSGAMACGCDVGVHLCGLRVGSGDGVVSDTACV